MQISIDFETYSEADLRAIGAYKYAAHPTTEVLCMAWAIDDEEPQLWTPDQPFPARLFDEIFRGAEIWAWNAGFERAIWEHVVSPRADAIGIEPDQWNDTAALAAALALPRALGKCAAVLGLAEQKDDGGRYLIQKLCKPYRGERRRDPHLLDELYAYCKQDVKTEREIKRYVQQYKPTTAGEREVWLLDQEINNRGLGIDTASASAAIEIIYKIGERLTDSVKELTTGELAGVGSRDQVMRWARSRGYKLTGYDKNTILNALADPALPDDVRHVLEVRRTLGKASTSKYQAMLNLAGEDGRARGLFWYHGAQTGRWAGRGFQPQNLPRPAFDDTDNCIKLFEHRDPELIEALYGDPMAALSSCLRGMIVPAKGHRLIVSDFSAIEARVLAWLADEQGPLDVFREGGDIYCHAATGIYGRTITPKDKEERQIGKVAVLALGYQGGVGAFQTMAKAYRVEVEDEKADEIKVKWRKAHKKIVRFWYDLEQAATNAVAYKGTVFIAGRVAFKVEGDFLFAKLPSGRRLAYYKPVVSNGELQFFATNGRTGQWCRNDTYGGKLCENVTQAVARDLLASAMLRLENAGYKVVASIHDEIICEMPIGEGSLATMEQLMCELPDWATGLPMAAEGFQCERYRK